MVEVHGFCDDRFRPLEVVFRSNLDEGVDNGASLAVTLHGEPVVDLWGGWRDERIGACRGQRTRSSGCSPPPRSPVIMAVLMLVDRGQLDLDAPIAEYWPEFAKNGKGAVTARQVLVHRSGLPGFGRSYTSDELADWEHMTGLLERRRVVVRAGNHQLLSLPHVRLHPRRGGPAGVRRAVRGVRPP